RAAVVRVPLRREPHAHRSAARSSGRLDEGHVDAIDVGSLLAIELNGDEVLVEQRGHRVVLERLALHDVAPVARGIPDRQKDRLVFGARFRERLVAPRKPIDWIARVLQEVGAALVREAIHRVNYDIEVESRPWLSARWRASGSRFSSRTASKIAS